MQLRQKIYPPNFWLRLHKWIQDPLPPPAKKSRRPSNKNIDICLTSLVPHIQWIVYRGSIDRKKGEIRSGKLPISGHQFNLIQRLGATKTFNQVAALEQIMKIQYNFEHKGYFRAIDHIQFRLQTQNSIISGKNLAFILRIRFHQKSPVLMN